MALLSAFFTREKPVSRAWLALAGGLSAGVLGALPAARGASDPLVLLCWLALIAPAAGFAAGAGGLALWPWGLLAPGAWMIALALLAAGSDTLLSGLLWGALAFSGLYAGGLGLGAPFARHLWRGTGALLLAAALLIGLPGRAGLNQNSFAEASPRLGALLVDLSPATLVAECAGIDWMRHRSVYQPAGTDWFSFERRPWRGPLAGTATFVLGCCLALVGRRMRRSLAAADP